MFKLFSRKQPVVTKGDFSQLKVDMHSHLLPGIDDGSRNIETSLQLIKGLTSIGYTKLITTPHIMWDMYKNTRDGILNKLELLQEAVNKDGIAVEIHAAAEYFLDDHVEELLKTNQPLLTISGNMVLVEFSLAHAPMGLKELLFEMQMKGYQPVIAHPERYIYLANNKEFYDELKEADCLFQLNSLSLAGYYGKSVQELANHLIKKGYYNLIGTDLHHQRHLEALQNAQLSQALDKLVATVKIINKQL